MYILCWKHKRLLILDNKILRLQQIWSFGAVAWCLIRSTTSIALVVLIRHEIKTFYWEGRTNKISKKNWGVELNLLVQPGTHDLRR